MNKLPGNVRFSFAIMDCLLVCFLFLLRDGLRLCVNLPEYLIVVGCNFEVEYFSELSI